MKICIFGGTFSPIHKGHIGMAVTAYDRFNLDKLYFIPSGDSYFKENVIPAKDRLQMTKLTLEDIKDDGFYDFSLSDIEVNREGASYSFETIKEFKLAFPDDELYFLVGQDTIYQMEKWKSPEYIMENCTILVAARKDDTSIDITEHLKNLTTKYNCNIKLFEYDNPISSSKIRELIQYNDSTFEKYITPSVCKYIIKNQLYK